MLNTWLRTKLSGIFSLQKRVFSYRNGPDAKVVADGTLEGVCQVVTLLTVVQSISRCACSGYTDNENVRQCVKRRAARAHI